MDDLRLPADLDLRLWLVMQEELVKNYEGMRELLKLHEQEMIFLWAGLCGSLVLVLTLAYHLKLLKEAQSGQ